MERLGTSIMLFANIFNFSLWASFIEFIGALLIIAYMFFALVRLIKTKNITSARLLIADGVITGLSFKLAGTLLKTIELRTWQQILMFVVIFALRTGLKRLFMWEQTRLQQPALLETTRKTGVQ